MNVPIKADILVIDIRENIRLEQRVVHCRIEGRELARGTAADLDLAQPVIPRLCGLGMNRVEVVIRIFPVDVGLCVGDADEGESDLDGDGGPLARIEGDESARARTRDRDVGVLLRGLPGLYA